MSRKTVHPYWGIPEILGFSVLYFSGIWLAGPFIANSIPLILLFWILVVAGGVYLIWISPVLLHGYHWKEWGWNFSWRSERHTGSLKKSLPTYLIITAAGSFLLIAYVILSSPETLYTLNMKAVAVKFVGYLVYGTVQSVIFFGFMLTRYKHILAEFLGNRNLNLQFYAAVLLTGITFSVFHFPNTPLMACTLFAGIIWAWIFYRRPNILLMGTSHAIVGTILHQVVQLHMRIGPFYENPDLYILREVVPGLKKLIGDLF